MTAPDRLADRTWWRWDVRLTATGLDTSTPQPDLSDPLLPGWLVHLLRERTGPGTHVHPDVVAWGGWDAWADRAEPGEPAAWRCIGSGDTEIAALVAALDATVPT